MPTLAQFRQATGPEMGPYFGPPNYAPVATSGSTVSQLEDTAYPILSSISQDDTWVDKFLYRPNAVAAGDKHRVIKTYTPASGLLLPDKTWTNAPYAGGVGEAYEILGMFDAPTLHGLINEGLKRCWLVVDITLTPIALQTRHALTTAAPWLRDKLDIYQAGYLATGEDRNKQDPFVRVIRGDVERDGNTFYLDHHPRSFNTSDTVYLRCLKRAYDHCKPTAGVFGDQAGLTLETDESPAATDWVAAAALVVAWRRFAKLLEPAANQRLIRDRAEAAAWFTDLTAEHFKTSLPQRTLRRIGHFGPAFQW